MKQTTIFFRFPRFLAVTFAIAIMFFIQSCSNDSDNLQEPQNKEIKTAEINIASKRPYPVDGTWSTASDLVSATNGCYVVNIRVYLTFEGTPWLMHSSNVSVGNCGKVATTGDCTGEYKGDTVIKDETEYDGCIIQLWIDKPEVYDQYLTERFKQTGI